MAEFNTYVLRRFYDLQYQLKRVIDRSAVGTVLSIGPSGPTGAVGSSGPTGCTGAVGPTGAVGAGQRGATGPAGSLGATGPIGYTGPVGVRGFTGPTGYTGALVGYTGPRGASGPTGAIGPMGYTGATGGTGTTGVKGPTGPSSLVSTLNFDQLSNVQVTMPPTVESPVYGVYDGASAITRYVIRVPFSYSQELYGTLDMTKFPYNTITNFLRDNCWTSLTVGTPSYTEPGIFIVDTTAASNNLTIAARNYSLFVEMKITLNYNAASASDYAVSVMSIWYQGGFWPYAYPNFSESFNIPTDVAYVISDLCVVSPYTSSASLSTRYMRVDTNPGGTCNCAISIHVYE